MSDTGTRTGARKSRAIRQTDGWRVLERGELGETKRMIDRGFRRWLAKVGGTHSAKMAITFGRGGE